MNIKFILFNGTKETAPECGQNIIIINGKDAFTAVVDKEYRPVNRLKSVEQAIYLTKYDTVSGKKVSITEHAPFLWTEHNETINNIINENEN